MIQCCQAKRQTGVIFFASHNTLHCRSGSENKQSPQSHISALGDAEQAPLAAGGMFARRYSQVRRHLTAVFELLGISNVSNQCHGWARRAKVPFKQLKDGKWVSSGKNFALALKEGLREAPGVEILEDTSVLDVLMRDGRPAGILALNIYRGELLVVPAKSVVLGTGGYQPFSLKKQRNGHDGRWCGIGFRAGADIADMEFLLSFPTAVASPYLRGSILPYVLMVYCGLKGGIWPQFRDMHGEVIAVPEEILEKTAFYKGFKLIKLVCTYY